VNLSSAKNFTENICSEKELCQELDDYIKSCVDASRDVDGEDSKKSKAKIRRNFPNLAGFCRYLKISVEDFEKLKDSSPSLFQRILTVLEDEALNADISPNLISAYLKKRLKYDSHSSNEDETSTQLQIMFEHDIFEDGG
jgi:hypothetical protein